MQSFYIKRGRKFVFPPSIKLLNNENFKATLNTRKIKRLYLQNKKVFLAADLLGFILRRGNNYYQVSSVIASFSKRMSLYHFYKGNVLNNKAKINFETVINRF
jgi:hypothetical protein